MKEQNYSNHKRLIIGYHFITFILIVVIFLFSIYNLINSLTTKWGMKLSILIFLISIVLLCLFYYARIFANTVQDRAIRAEENLRHFVLAGKLLDPRLSISQIIALRFAPDEEFIELTKKTSSENLKANEIKKLIKNWKADHNRA